MVAFQKCGVVGFPPHSHDIGVLFEDKQYLGTAIYCMSPEYPRISMNIAAFRFASKCFQYLFCRNCLNQTVLIPMSEAIDLFKRGHKRKETDDFIVFEWHELENPSVVYEIPF
jgi:hypothetical protein